MGDVIVLHKRKKLKKEQAEALQLAFEFDLDETVRAEIDSAIYRLTEEPRERWLFMRVSPEAFRQIVKAIKGCRNVATTLSVWQVAITHMRWDTGEVLASRTQLAQDAGVALQSVSTAMSDLVRIGVVLRYRRGRKVIYNVNPQVCWHGHESSRQAAVKEAPVLKLVVDREKGGEQS